VIRSSESTVKVTAMAADRPVPVMVTAVPRASGPEEEAREVTYR
jgi:hypothetical protein